MTEVKEGRAGDKETGGRSPLPSVGSDGSGCTVWWLRLKTADSDRPEFEYEIFHLPVMRPQARLLNFPASLFPQL